LPIKETLWFLLETSSKHRKAIFKCTSIKSHGMETKNSFELPQSTERRFLIASYEIVKK